MDGESIDRLMDIILQMKINLTHIHETLQQQTFEICQELGAVYEEQKKTLANCLGSIDAKLEQCRADIEEYQRLHTSLEAMRLRLVQLGGAPSALPMALPCGGVEAFLSWRLREFTKTPDKL